jgi:hypothetical protein
MATLTFSATDSYAAPAAAKAKPARIGFFARLVAAMMESRERQARREINRVAAMMGESTLTRDATKAGTLPF